MPAEIRSVLPNGAACSRNRTMWGMMLGFSGINCTSWLSLAWLPGYLQTAYNLDLKSTGLMAAIPFLFGAAGMLVNGYVTDWLVKGGMASIKSRKICIITRDIILPLTLVVPQATTSMTASMLIGMALFCIRFCRNILLGLDPRRSCFSHDGVGGQYPELCQLHLRLFCANHYWFYC